MRIEGDLTGCVFILCVTLTIILFAGSPDFMDSIIYWLSDGNYDVQKLHSPY